MTMTHTSWHLRHGAGVPSKIEIGIAVAVAVLVFADAAEFQNVSEVSGCPV